MAPSSRTCWMPCPPRSRNSASRCVGVLDAESLATAPPDDADAARRGLALFLVVAFGVAWGLWGLLWRAGGLARPESFVVLLVSMYAPTLGVLAAWRIADPRALRL